jgi:hypothetical protein
MPYPTPIEILAGAQAPMPTALGLAGYDRFAAEPCLIFKVRGA